MMKRPRSFISTLLILLGLATVTIGLTVHVRPARAESMPRLLDPRAGDPDEPGAGMPAPDLDPSDPPVIQSGGATSTNLPQVNSSDSRRGIFDWLSRFMSTVRFWSARR